MTNWMTAAGIALIAGGLATLICFRTVLFGPEARRGRRAARDIQPKSRRAGGGRRRARAAEPVPAPEPVPEPVPASEPVAVPERVVADETAGGLASIGLGDEPYESGFPSLVEPEPEAPRYPDRIDGWVRPEYQHVPEQPPSGEYWTPIPVDLDPDPEPSAKGYGWPAPVERLPAAGDYEPVTGFDAEPEPTEVVTALPGERRVNLPRTWSSRNDKPIREWRTESEPRRRTELYDDAPPPARRRPRPRPRPSGDSGDRNTRVYVSRHAAEPPPR